MKLIRLMTVVLVGVVAAQADAASPTEKLLKAARKAAGGKALDRIQSTLIQGSAQGPDGATGRFTWRLQAPDRSRMDLEVGELKVTECYNGKSAWRLDGEVLMTWLGVDAKRLRLEALLANGRFKDLKKQRVLAQPPMTSELDGRSVQSIEFLLDEARATLFFDTQSGQHIGQRRERGEESPELILGDLRAVDGVMEPHTLRLRQGSREWVVSVEKVEHNGGVAAKDFDFPVLPGSDPLPEVKPLLESLIANQERLDELREQYTFVVTQTESQQNKDGSFRETSTKIYEITPAAGEFVRRLVSKDGKPLDAEEQAKEDRKVDKRVEKMYERRDERRREKAEGKENDEELGVSDFLRLSHITSIRREDFRGQPVIAFDFEPPTGLNPKNRTERFIIRLAGTIWIDEAARQVARVEARLTRSFKIGGGILASLAESSAFVFEQEKVRGELWLPSYAEVVVAGKFLLFGRFKQKIVERYSDYKKYEVESSLEVSEHGVAPTPTTTP